MLFQSGGLELENSEINKGRSWKKNVLEMEKARMILSNGSEFLSFLVSLVVIE